MKKTVTLFLLAWTFAAITQTNSQLTEVVRHKIDSTYTALIKKHKVIGLSLAIVDRNGILYSAVYGFSDVANKKKATDQTIYRIGSMTKSFTALSIMQLQERHLVSTDSSVRAYLPELRLKSRFNESNPLYVRDILAHISGLPSDISNGFFCDSPPDIKWVINELNKQTAAFPSNYIHSYSNIGYGLLGEVIARTGKGSYSAWLKEQIFQPLHMNSSYVEDDPTLAANFSKAYIKNKEIKEPQIRDQAAGLIHSNVIDVAAYVRMYLNKGMLNGVRIVSETSIDEMTRNRLETLRLPTTKNWGFGLYTFAGYTKAEKDSTPFRIIGHGGDTYAFHSDMAYIPELGIGVVVLTNSDKGAYINDATDLLKLYLKHATSQKLVISRRPKRTDTGEIVLSRDNREIQGTYNAGDFIIKVKGSGKITFKQGPAKVIFKPKKNDSVNYVAKARIYGVVPIKIKGEEFRFVRLDDKIYLKQVSVKSGNEVFVVMKGEKMPVPENWSRAFGHYRIKDNFYTCAKCTYGDPEGSTATLKEKDGMVVFRMKSKKSSSLSYLDLVSDDLGVTGGVGRGCGETVSLLSNGNIYYSGFEF